MFTKNSKSSNLSWDPIDNFKGVFDGDGHYIKNLYINSTEDYVGLFGKMSGGRIKNLNVSGSVTGKKYVGANATLYNVLNAYVNMVGIRLNIENDGTMTPNTTDKGKYSGDAFFEVTCVKNENVYSVTIKPVSEEFENPVKIMGYWKEFIRINNNNSTVRNMITNEQIASDGTLTFDFTMEAKESNN